MAHAGTSDIEMVTIPRNVYETLLETLEVLSDKAEIESIKRGIEDIRTGRVMSEEEFLKKHKWLRSKWTWGDRMFKLIFNDEFTKNFDKLKDREIQRRIYKRVQDLK